MSIFARNPLSKDCHSTKVLLRRDTAGQGGGSELAQQIFGLSEQEKAFTERAERGSVFL